MHQTLSYDTTVRAGNSSQDYRDTVSKRTCTTAMLTVGFFMLITGYFLGSFVVERKFHIRQLILKKAIRNNDDMSIELNSSDYAKLQELRAYDNIKEQLLAAAQVLNKLHQQDEHYLSTSLNTEIFNKYVSCTQDIPPNTNIAASQFIEQLIDNTVARQRDCMRIIQVVIDNQLANSQL